MLQPCYIIIDESFFSDAYELCCKKLYLVLGVNSALRARLISSNKWSEFQFGHGLEVWKFEKQYKKQLLNVITAIPILFPRGKERQVRTFFAYSLNSVHHNTFRFPTSYFISNGITCH